jgi:predicted nucleic acid-binding protein
MNIFIDTSAILAVLNESDPYHKKAAQVWTEILSSDSVMVSSNYVILETVAVLQNRFGIEAIRLFENDVRPVIDLIWIGEPVHSLAMAILMIANRRNLSFVDCTSFQVMRQTGLDYAFTFDPHFSEQGFKVIPNND